MKKSARCMRAEREAREHIAGQQRRVCPMGIASNAVRIA